MKFLFLFLPALLTARAGETRVAYHETFPDYRDATRYTRIAQASQDWKILTEPDGTRFMRVTIAPKPGKLRGLILWDLAPIQFNRFSIEARVNGTDGAPVFLGSAAADRADSSFGFKAYGATGAGTTRAPLPADGTWVRYEVALPADLTKIHTKGKEVSPFVRGKGEAMATWEGVDFSNHGFTALFFHAEVPQKSPLIGKTYTMDFRLLELRDADEVPAASVPDTGKRP